MPKGVYVRRIKRPLRGKHVPCKNCGKVIYKEPYKLVSENSFCSRSCKSKYLVIRHKLKGTGIFSEESRKKVAISKIGKKRPKEVVKKISISRKGKYCLSKHPMWAGEDIKYVGLHKRIKSIKGDPKICEHCGSIDKKKYEWANIDHKYSTSPNDYIRLCTQCHRKYDIEHNNYKSAIVVASTEARITLTNLS